MMSKNPRQTVKQFKKEFGIHSITKETLENIIQRQGYSVVEFNHIFNDENVATLIDSLNINDDALRSRGFTYEDRNHRIVFVHEDLSVDEKLIVLAHEEGHIYCNHMSSLPVIGKDVQEEYEANEFSHYLLNPDVPSKLSTAVSKYKIPLIICAIILVVSISVGFVAHSLKAEKKYYGEYYITSDGNRYHEKNCIFVKDKTNVHRMTEEEFESGEYEPCQICLP